MKAPEKAGGAMGGGRVVYEVGYGGRAPGELLAAVERLGAALFDVRLSPRSRQPAWNRGRLEAVFGARYAHVPELGNANYKDPAGGIELADPEAGLARVRAAGRPVVLMCACRDYRGCHRRTVAELLEAEGWRVEALPSGKGDSDPDNGTAQGGGSEGPPSPIQGSQRGKGWVQPALAGRGTGSGPEEPKEERRVTRPRGGAGKRGNGEGSIHQRKDGYWAATVSLGHRDGKRVRQTFYGKTRREVAERLKVALRDQQQGLPVALERQTVAQFLDGWLADIAKPALRPSTYVSYESYVRIHLKPALGRHQLAALAPQHVQAFLNERLASGLAPRTVQYLRAILRRALGQALKWGLVGRNVATLVDPPRSRRPEIRPLTPAQARRFLDAVKGDRMEALYAVAVALGLRQGEALGLRWEEVDLTDGTLRVRHALQRVDGKLRLVEPKTQRSRRTIAMPAAATAALGAHRDRQAFERAAAGDRWVEGGYVFTTAIGTPLDGTAVTKRLRLILEGAGLPRQRFHDLRHCCASLLLAQGVHPRVVMEVLGHSQIGLTMDTYSHVMPAAQREAATLMDDILGGNG